MNKFDQLFNTIMEEAKASKKHIIKESSIDGRKVDPEMAAWIDEHFDQALEIVKGRGKTKNYWSQGRNESLRSRTKRLFRGYPLQEFLSDKDNNEDDAIFSLALTIQDAAESFDR